MFIRFVIHQIDEQSGRRQGLFQALGELRDDQKLNEYEENQYDELSEWFRENLKKPSSPFEINQVPRTRRGAKLV